MTIEDHDNELKKWAEKGAIRPFPKPVFDALRPFHYGGVPLSILLFVTEMNNGKCYERSSLMALALDECKRHVGEILSLKLSYGEDKGGHAFIEAYDYVLDTSNGLIFTKEAYWDLEKPVIFQTMTKEDIIKQPEIQRVLAGDFQKEKYSLPLILPLLENYVNKPVQLSTKMNQKFLKDEIAKLKAAINYDEMKRNKKENTGLDITDNMAHGKKRRFLRERANLLLEHVKLHPTANVYETDLFATKSL